MRREAFGVGEGGGSDPTLSSRAPATSLQGNPTLPPSPGGPNKNQSSEAQRDDSSPWGKIRRLPSAGLR